MNKDLDILRQALNKGFKEGNFNMDEAALIINSFNRINVLLTAPKPEIKEEKNEERTESSKSPEKGSNRPVGKLSKETI